MSASVDTLRASLVPTAETEPARPGRPAPSAAQSASTTSPRPTRKCANAGRGRPVQSSGLGSPIALNPSFPIAPGDPHRVTYPSTCSREAWA